MYNTDKNLQRYYVKKKTKNNNKKNKTSWLVVVGLMQIGVASVVIIMFPW